MSDPILGLLQSDDPKQRQRGITAAAKKRDPRYLKHLAQIVKSDPDEETRRLAKRAGAHIHKHTQEAALGVSTPPPKLSQAPSKPISEEDREQAMQHYDKAFDLHLKGREAHAALELGTAFFLNPNYAQDQTAVAFAAEMTGLPPAQAIQYISDPANWREFTDKKGGFTGEAVKDEPIFSNLFLWIGGAIAILVILAIIISLIDPSLLRGLMSLTIEEVTGGRVSIPTQIPPTATPLP